MTGVFPTEKTNWSSDPSLDEAHDASDELEGMRRCKVGRIALEGDRLPDRKEPAKLAMLKDLILRENGDVSNYVKCTSAVLFCNKKKNTRYSAEQ